jgi:succinate-semialdehyde dehydrogenase/glutarate-semialdehyde dehydrogenase
MTQRYELSDLIRADNFIDGKWVPAASGERFAVTDPATGDVIAQVADSGPADARAATDAAARAFPAWRDTLPKDRAAVLHRWHALIVENADALGRLISLEQGKPFAEGRGEVMYGASYVAWFADEATRIYGDIIPQQQRGKRMSAVKEPVGIVAAITPWNFPLAMIARKIAPALAAGCTVVGKPAEDTPLTALALVMLAHEAGVPAGALNLIVASRENAQDAVADWLEDGRVRKITFTGSTPVGKYLARESAGTLKKLSLELGGNAPFIVFDDADIDAAVQGAIASKFRNTGQTCVCVNRFYVQDGVYDAFTQALTRAVHALRVGNGLEGEFDQGPLINEAALAKVQAHVADAVSHGAKILTGGKPHALGGTFYEPTVLADAKPSMLIAGEETFGPVAACFRFETEEEVIAAANDTPYGLSAYFYTRDLGRAWRVGEALESGMVGINEGIISTEVAPFGGVKESGLGREGSKYGLDEYMELKYMMMAGLGR